MLFILIHLTMIMRVLIFFSNELIKNYRGALIAQMHFTLVVYHQMQGFMN